MAEQESTEKNDNAADIRNKLIARLAVAGGLVAVLLGILAFFDYLASPSDEVEAPVFTQPVPVAPKKEVSKPVLPGENLPEPPAPEKAEAPEAAAKAEVPPPPVVEAKPEVMPEKAPTAAPAAKAPAAAPVRPAKPVPEVTMAPETAPTAKPATPSASPSEIKETPAPAKPSARVTETKTAQPVQPVQPVQPPNPLRLFSGFVLQAGVFTSIQRAEEIHAKLTLSGVPSKLETRVQVGPFRTRQEAEAAQVKLKELGIESILVPPKGGR